MGNSTHLSDTGIKDSLKSSLSKITGRVALKAPPAKIQSTDVTSKPVKSFSPKPTDSQPSTRNESLISTPTKPASSPHKPSPTSRPSIEKESVSPPAVTPNSESNFLASDVSIQGDLRFAGSLVFDGRLRGETKSEGALSLQSNALLEGDISVKSLIVAGKVVGNVTATESVHLTATGVVIGDIITGELSMEANAVFRGQAKVGAQLQKKTNTPQAHPNKKKANRNSSARRPRSENTQHEQGSLKLPR